MSIGVPLNQPASVRGHALARLVPEIEGLRALAVIAVVLHHFFPALLPGGFCGVDIFFVISGYVVGGRLIEAALNDRLSLRTFYAARARRLLPALATVLAVTFALGWLFMTGTELAALGKHMSAASVFSNNFLLASEAGYFDAPSATKPLLHLWSLAIEEQFYLLAPMLIWLGMRSARLPSSWVLRLGGLSLLWLVWRQDAEPASMFYNPAYRFWEIGAGVAVATWKGSSKTADPTRVSGEIRVWSCVLFLLALLPLLAEVSEPGLGQNPIRSAALVLITLTALCGVVGSPTHKALLVRLIELAPQIGVLLLVVSVSAMSPGDWPGVQTFLPVLGTALVLVHTNGGGVLPVLRSKAAVFFGAISYPLYLWHWPMLVFTRLVHPEWGTGPMLSIVVLAVLLAWLTKVLIEAPFRFGKFATRDVARLPWQLPAAVAGLLAAVGMAATLSGGIPARFSPNMRALAAWSDPDAYQKWRLGKCYYYLNNSSDYAAECSPPHRADMPTVLLWGDSHAAQLYQGMQAIAGREPSFQLAQWTMGSCPPSSRPVSSQSTPCEIRRARDQRHLAAYRPEIVILAGAWGLYVRNGADIASLAADIAETVGTARRDGVGQVLVVGPGPLWNAALSSDLFRYMVRSGIEVIPDRFGKIGPSLYELDRALRKASIDAGAAYLSPLSSLCTEAGCRVIGDRTQATLDLLFFDRDHLTPSGSRLLIELARPVLEPVIRSGMRPVNSRLMQP